MHFSLLLQFVVGSTQKWRRMTGLYVSQALLPVFTGKSKHGNFDAN